MTDTEFLIDLCRKSRALPSEISTAQWVTENVELSPVTSDLSGKVSFEFFPANRIFLNYLDNPRTRKCTVMKCSQSGFTDTTIWYLLRRIVERPVTTMWVGPDAEKTQEDCKKKLYPAIRECKAAQAVAPGDDDRERWTKRLIMFDTMNLLIRGSNAVGGLRGDSVGLLICDERADWKPGRIHKVRQRLSTKSSPLEISIGAAGVEDDELHTDWKEGSQTFIYFICPKCQKSQPFRFGKNPNVLFPEPRTLGGLVWEKSDLTQPNGVWNEEEFKKTVRYECEGCGHRFHNAEKIQLLKTAHEVHRNPDALPKNFSLDVDALILIWNERDWANIAWEWVKADEATHRGDLEPLKNVVTETLGEPWSIKGTQNDDNDILDRCGDYTLGTLWMEPTDPKRMDPNTVLVMTFDRQMFHFVFVIRQWRKNGQSRLVDYGKLVGYDELREKQNHWKISNRCVWGDDGGPKVSEFRQTALRYGWNVLKGEDKQHFTVKENGEPKRIGFMRTNFDPGIGTVRGGPASMPAFLWSNDWYKDKLYLLFIKGLGPLWELPRREDVSADYISQVMANSLMQRPLRDGGFEDYWRETGINDLGDCELMHLVVADQGGLTRVLVTK